MTSMNRGIGAALITVALATASVSGLDFEKVDSWADDGFDISAEVFFSDESTLWAFRNEYAIRMTRGQETPLAMWALSGINLHGEPLTGPAKLHGYREQTYLRYFDPIGQQMVVNLNYSEEGPGVFFRILDMKSSTWTDLLEWQGGQFPFNPGFNHAYDEYNVDEVKIRYGIELPRGQSFTAAAVLSFDKMTGMAEVDLQDYKDSRDYDEKLYRLHRTIHVDTSAMGELTGLRAHTPIERVLWTDGRQFVFISESNCFLGYLQLDEGVSEYRLTVIPGALFLQASLYITDSRGVRVRRGNPFSTNAHYLGEPYFGCVKTWGHRFLMLDASPVRQVVTDMDSLGKVFKVVNTGNDWSDDLNNKSLLDTILRNVIIPSGWSKGYSDSWSGSAFEPLDLTVSMPYRIAAYDPRTNTVEDTGLPYFYTAGRHPLSISPKGNLIAFAEKDLKTGKFISYSIYRIILDAEVNNERVRFRSLPTTMGEILGMFSKGERVKVLDRSEAKMRIDSNEDYWYLVRRSDGSEVWMYGAYLTIVD